MAEAASGAGPAAAGGRVPSRRDGLLAFAHLAVLSTVSVAQPLFSLLSENPQFFAARGSTPGDIILFGLLLVVGPPILLYGLELLAGLVAPRARRGVHLGLLGLLSALLAIQLLKGAIGVGDPVLVVLALAIGAAAATAYARAQPVRSFVSVLTPVPVVFLAIFLFLSPVARITLAGEAEAKSIGEVPRVPVAMVVFDELPTISLMDSRGRLDDERYPGFAALARDSTWFRNAYTIYDSTGRAVPAIMDGTYPEEDELATSADHPDSIFAMLGKSHRMNVSEAATIVCPRDLCDDPRLDEPLLERLGAMGSDLGLVYAHVVSPPDMQADLPSISDTWGDFAGAEAAMSAAPEEGNVAPEPPESLKGDRRRQFEDWVARIDGGGGKPQLSVKHALLPHVPWQYLPDGRVYETDAYEPIPNLSRQSYEDEAQFDQLQMRHLLQLGFADLELRALLRRLKRTGVYDETMIVVTADHGVAFQDGRFNRRRADRGSVDEIAPVPLLIKRPRQRRGRIDDALVETTDIVPTILDVLGVPKPQAMDGHSAYGPVVAARDEVRVFYRNLAGAIRLSREEFEAERDAALADRIRELGEGADGPERIYRSGPNQKLLGLGAPLLDSGRDSEGEAELVDPGAYGEVDTGGPFIPTWVVGRVSGGGEPKRDIAVVVNGVVEAVGNTFELETGGGEIFAVMIPPSALRDGRNEVEIYEVVGGDELRRMGGV